MYTYTSIDPRIALGEVQYHERSARKGFAPKLGKSNFRSAEEKRRRNRLRKERMLRNRYRFRDYEILDNVLDVGVVPVKKYYRHQKRWAEASKPFTLKQASGYRLVASRSKKRDLPYTVVMALLKIYSQEVSAPRVWKSGWRNRAPTKRKTASSVRTNSNRTRSDSLTRAIKAAEDLNISDLNKRPGLVARVCAEIGFRQRDDPSFFVDIDLSHKLRMAEEHFTKRELLRLDYPTDFSAKALNKNVLDVNDERYDAQYDGSDHPWF
jgi:hypothetical protein